MPQGSRGVIEAFNDFTGGGPDVFPATGTILGGGWGMVSVNEGSTAVVADEPGGVLQVTTDIGDNDNFFAFAGPFQPADGVIVFEGRFKIADITTGAVYAGFTETLALDTPVMPAEFATATMTYNGTGGMVGFNFDSDGTTDTWRALAGDGGAVSSGADANGTATTEGAPVNDEFDIIRVEIDPSGTARCYHDGKLIKTISSAVTAGDNFYAVLGIENRSAAASVLEIDYLLATGSRDWTV